VRRRARAVLAPLVDEGVETVVRLQRWQSPLLDAFFKAVSMFGTHQFYLVILPLFFWLGFSRQARHLTALMSFGIYLGNVFKDLFCLPRPRAPPAIRMMRANAHEYGLPSTHSVNAIMFPLFLFFDTFHGDEPLELSSSALYHAALAAALTLVLLVGLSRIYLGMHCVADVAAGYVLGLAILGAWMRWGAALLDWAVLSGSNVGTVLVGLVVAMIVLHPVAVHDCPCFEDSVCFGGTILGVVSGIAHLHALPHVPTGPRGEVLFSYARSGLAGSIFRVAVGLCLVLLVRSALKAACLRTLRRLPLSRASPHPCARKHERTDEPDSDPVVNVSAVLADVLHSSFFNVLDVQTVTRIVAYCGVGYAATCIAPAIFHWLGI
jgi:membrane-associated phospholipid phosphatase